MQGPPSASEWAFQGLEVAREEDVGSSARGTKGGSMPVQLLRKDFCKLTCMKKYYFQGKLATVRTGWKLHVKV